MANYVPCLLFYISGANALFIFVLRNHIFIFHIFLLIIPHWQLVIHQKKHKQIQKCIIIQNNLGNLTISKMVWQQPFY